MRSFLTVIAVAAVVTPVLIVAALVAAVFYMTSVPGKSHTGPLPALSEAEAATAKRLGEHIRAIASRPHNVKHFDELERSALYIEKVLSDLGHEIKRQAFDVDGVTVRNIETTIEPAGPSRGTIVVGAHYDSYDVAPGANDNGTGAAAVLELARLLADLRGKLDTRIRLVLFVNEEPPYFRTEDMGSHRYAKALAQTREPIIGMFSLETMGYFSDEPGSQKYPVPFNLIYPNTGNFIAFVATLDSREFARAVIQSFRSHTPFPSVGGAAPAFIPGIDWSDHASFAELGIPALMVTDTAPFRYPHYHKLTDTPDKIDLEKLGRVTLGIERVVRDMTNRNWPTKPVVSNK